MHDIVNLFKKGVPRQKKVYQKYLETCKIQNFSYVNFKDNNVALVEIKEYLTSIDEYYYLSPNQIENIFEYLKEYTIVSSFSKIKKIYKQLNELSDFLSNRYNSDNSLHGPNSRENCLLIINKIDELKCSLAKRVGRTILEIENISSFESVVGQILNPKELVFDEEKLYFLINNMQYLFMHDRNNRTFNDNFCKQVEKAKVTRDKDKMKYYKSLYIYLTTIKALGLDEEYLTELFEINPFINDERLIDRKIYNMPIHKKTGKRVVNDYILSIDNDDTKKIDDAFSIEKINDCYLVGIHIADVYSLGYFEEDSLDVNQKNNVNKSKASLNRNKERDAVSLFVLVDNNGLIRDYRMLKTTLVTNSNLIYDDICKILSREEVDPRLKESVVNLVSIYNLLENTRFPLTPTIQNLGYVIVSKLMVLCGSIYSSEFTKRNIPAIYLAGTNGDNYCSIENLEFETGFKGFNTYSRVTSPIIDRPSLINQFFIHKCIFSRLSEEKKGTLALKLRPIVDRINKNKEKEKEREVI